MRTVRQGEKAKIFDVLKFARVNICVCFLEFGAFLGIFLCKNVRLDDGGEGSNRGIGRG